MQKKTIESRQLIEFDTENMMKNCWTELYLRINTFILIRKKCVLYVSNIEYDYYKLCIFYPKFTIDKQDNDV
jgi:hypothetical protein